MIGYLKKGIFSVAALLTALSSISASASEKAQLGWWGNSDTTAGSAMVAAQKEMKSIHLTDGRGVALTPYMHLSNDVIAHLSETIIQPQNFADGRGVGLNYLDSMVASLDELKAADSWIAVSWGNAGKRNDNIDTSKQYPFAFDQAAVAYNPAIMWDGRGVGLHQALLNTDSAIGATISAAMGGN